MRYVVASGAGFLVVLGCLAAQGTSAGDRPAGDSVAPRTEAECKPIDLRNGSLKGVKPSLQNGFGDCYVHAALGMLQGYMNKSGTLTDQRTPSPEFVMAQALARGTMKDGKTSPISFREEKAGKFENRSQAPKPDELLDSFFDADFPYGRACHTIGRIRIDGTCSASYTSVRSTMYSMMSNHRFTSKNYLTSLNDWVNQQVANTEFPHLSEAVCTEEPGMSVEQFKRVLRGLGEVRAKGVYDSLLQKNGGDRRAAQLDFEAALLKFSVDDDLAICRRNGDYLSPKDTAAIPGCSAIGFIDEGGHKELLPPQVMSDTLNYLLEKDGDLSVPPAIEFCSSALSDHDGIIAPQRRNFGSDLSYLNDPKASQKNFDGCGYHVAIVIGRKWEGGACKLLVRDSNKCQGPKCETGATGKLNPDDNVYVVDQGRLARNIVRIATLGEFDDLKAAPASLLRYRDEILPQLKQTKDVDGLGM